MNGKRRRYSERERRAYWIGVGARMREGTPDGEKLFSKFVQGSTAGERMSYINGFLGEGNLSFDKRRRSGIGGGVKKKES